MHLIELFDCLGFNTAKPSSLTSVVQHIVGSLMTQFNDIMNGSLSLQIKIKTIVPGLADMTKLNV